MFVIPLFLENRFLVEQNPRRYGCLKYYYSQNEWLLDDADNARFITDKIRTPSFPKEMPFWGLSEYKFGRYRSLFYRRSEKKPKRRGPRWFRFLLSDGKGVLVRDLIYGGYRKKCHADITPNCWQDWKVFEPMSCKETWKAHPVYPKWTRGTYTIEKDYYPDFERELYWSRCLNSGYPIQRADMYFTPCYYEYVRDELNAGFYVMKDGVIKHYLVNYSPISHQVVWKRQQLWDYQPNVQYGVYGGGSFIRMQPPKKPNMDTLECLVDVLPHPKKMFSR